MRKSESCIRVAFTVVALIVLTTSLGAAQNPPKPANSERKIASRVAPSYPELAKRTHMHGTVKIEAVVRASGSVRSTRVLGGNPVLVNAAVDAVAQWKFEPAQNETTEVIQLEFDPR
jgi:protein TonB